MLTQYTPKIQSGIDNEHSEGIDEGIDNYEYQGINETNSEIIESNYSCTIATQIIETDYGCNTDKSELGLSNDQGDVLVDTNEMVSATHTKNPGIDFSDKIDTIQPDTYDYAKQAGNRQYALSTYPLSDDVLHEMERFFAKCTFAVRIDSDFRLSIYDILKGIGIKNNHSSKIKKFRGQDTDNTVTYAIPIWRWTENRDIVFIDKPTHSTPMIKVNNLHILVKFLMSSCRWSTYDQYRACSLVDIEPEIRLVQTEAQHIQSIVVSLPYKCIQQFKIGPYRLDMYIADYKIAVECDEYAHKRYDQKAEQERQMFVSKQLGCTWVRFDPYCNRFCIFSVIRNILEIIKSNDQI